MKLQSISRDTAENVWNARIKNNDFDASSINIDTIGNYEHQLTELELDDLVDCLEKVEEKFASHNPKDNKNIGGQIDAEITEIVHSELSKFAHTHELSQIGFWRWLSNVACDGYFWKFIMWRLNSDQAVNWGIASPGSIIEVYFYRAWLRAHKMYDKSLSDPYKYAKIGSSDVWRSHILRQDFGRDREFVKAFLDTIYDKQGKTVVRTKELRKKLVPALRAWTSGASFSHLSYEENLKLISYLRERGI